MRYIWLQLQRNYLIIWIAVLLSIALVLMLLLSGCSRSSRVVVKPTPTVAVIESGPSCTDSESLPDIALKGIVSGSYANGTEFLFEDACISELYLVEYFCEGDHPANQNFICKTGCRLGRCTST